MKEYHTIETLLTDETSIVERINFCHIPLIYVHDTVPTVFRNIISQQGEIQLATKEKTYLLLKKSGKKKWADISFYNYNWDEYPSFRPKIANNNESYQIIKEIYTRGKINVSEKIQCHFSTEYNLAGQFLNIQPLQDTKNNDPIYYAKESHTISTFTLYLFYFYAVRPYSEKDLHEIQWLRQAQQQDLSSAEDLLQDSLNRLQTEQINELISRDMSILLPTNFFEQETYRNLHPNFRFHSVFDLLINSPKTSTLLLPANKTITSIPHLPQKKAAHNVGIIVLDLVDFKRFFNDDNYTNSLNLVKAFQSDITEIIHTYSGCVYKTGGDSFLAFVQKENKRDTVRSLVNMALAIQNTPWKTRIGLNWVSQPFFEGYIGPLELREHGVYGADVNIAARLEHKVKEFGNQGILLPAEISPEELADIIHDYRMNSSATQFAIEEKRFAGIPENGGTHKENGYFYIVKIQT